MVIPRVGKKKQKYGRGGYRTDRTEGASLVNKNGKRDTLERSTEIIRKIPS
jgi:hypothetical protein